MHFGILKSFIPSRGFGFIEAANDNGTLDKYFLHARKIKHGFPVPGAGVHFNILAEREGEYPTAVDALIGDVIPKYQQQAATARENTAGSAALSAPPKETAAAVQS